MQRDYQRERVYAWEQEFVFRCHATPLYEEAEVIAWVERISRDFRKLRTPRVRFSTRKGMGGASCSWSGQELVFGVQGLADHRRWVQRLRAQGKVLTVPSLTTDAIVMHEMAHSLSPLHERHGAVFVGIYIMLLAHYGLRSLEAMKAELVDLGIDYEPQPISMWLRRAA